RVGVPGCGHDRDLVDRLQQAEAGALAAAGQRLVGREVDDVAPPATVVEEPVDGPRQRGAGMLATGEHPDEVRPTVDRDRLTGTGGRVGRGADEAGGAGAHGADRAGTA